MAAAAAEARGARVLLVGDVGACSAAAARGRRVDARRDRRAVVRRRRTRGALARGADRRLAAGPRPRRRATGSRARRRAPRAPRSSRGSTPPAISRRAGAADALVTGPVSKDAIVQLAGARRRRVPRAHRAPAEAAPRARGGHGVLVAGARDVARHDAPAAGARVPRAVTAAPRSRGPRTGSRGCSRGPARRSAARRRGGAQPARRRGRPARSRRETPHRARASSERARLAFARRASRRPRRARFRAETRVSPRDGRQGRARWTAWSRMYHDQATIPMKLAGFGEAVNVSLGLPIVRTSVDHGTAYDRAGTWTADARGMRAALALARPPRATSRSGRRRAACRDRAALPYV